MPFTPHDAGLNCLDRADALLREASRVSSWTLKADLRRMSIVMAVAALDTYMHRLILHRAYEHDELPGKLAKLSLPFEYVLDQTDAIAEAARAAPRNNRPRVGLKRQLRDRLLKETYQSYDDVSHALGMAGFSGNWTKIGQRLTPAREPSAIEQRLNGIVSTRDRIVHEGHYERLERPQHADLIPCVQKTTEADLLFIRDLVGAIHDVVSAPGNPPAPH